MLNEVMESLAVKPGGRYVDATIGDGGHAERILERSAPDGVVLGLDRDEQALARTRDWLARFGARLILHRASFERVAQILPEIGWPDGVDGMLVDLGVSTLQLVTAGRGFSFSADGPLDMRMDQTEASTVADLLAELEEDELSDLLRRFGEERAARRISRSIIARRPLQTTGDLRRAVLAAGVRGRPGHDPATRTFQALRIALNDELGRLERLLADGWKLLRPGARMVVLSYHSLEDRLVKEAFRRWSADCLCPKEQPVCNCGWTPRVRPIVRKRQRPDPAEIARNPRARSAGLRSVERLAA
jgi:16S rRNA (cytosine1402-N4)-methyltransferase